MFTASWTPNCSSWTTAVVPFGSMQRSSSFSPSLPMTYAPAAQRERERGDVRGVRGGRDLDVDEAPRGARARAQPPVRAGKLLDRSSSKSRICAAAKPPLVTVLSPQSLSCANSVSFTGKAWGPVSVVAAPVETSAAAAASASAASAPWEELEPQPAASTMKSGSQGTVAKRSFMAAASHGSRRSRHAVDSSRLQSALTGFRLRVDSSRCAVDGIRLRDLDAAARRPRGIAHRRNPTLVPRCPSRRASRHAGEPASTIRQSSGRRS